MAQDPHARVLPPLAATAPPADADDDEPLSAEEREDGQNLNELCEAWARWCHTRRLYVKPSAPVSLLGKLRQPGTGRSSSGGPDAANSAQLSAFHLAVLAEPESALDRRVFELHYYWQVRNVKSAAADLGISRQHWYRLLRDFRVRAHRSSLAILDFNLKAAEQLPSRVDAL